VGIFPPRESLVSYIPAGDGKIVKLFYSVTLPKSYLGKASGADDLLAHVALLAPGEEAELGAHAEEAHPPLPHALLHVPVQRQALNHKVHIYYI
jgi:hypothetical protein